MTGPNPNTVPTLSAEELHMRRFILTIVAAGCAWLAGCGGGSSDAQPKLQGPPDPRVKGLAPVGGASGALQPGKD